MRHRESKGDNVEPVLLPSTRAEFLEMLAVTPRERARDKFRTDGLARWPEAGNFVRCIEALLAAGHDSIAKEIVTRFKDAPSSPQLLLRTSAVLASSGNRAALAALTGPAFLWDETADVALAVARQAVAGGLTDLAEKIAEGHFRATSLDHASIPADAAVGEASAGLRKLVRKLAAQPGNRGCRRDLVKTLFREAKTVGEAPFFFISPRDLGFAKRLGRYWLTTGKVKEGAAVLNYLVRLEPDDWNLRSFAADALMRAGEWQAAIRIYEPVVRYHADKVGSYQYYTYQFLKVRAGESEDLIDVLDDAFVNRPNMGHRLVFTVGEEDGKVTLKNNPSVEEFLVQQRLAIERDVPAVLLNTLPKSASVWILSMLSALLRAPSCRLANNWYARDKYLIVPSWTRAFARGGATCQEHFPPTPENLRRLEEAGVRRMILHLRDPRQATLSWIHHIERFLRENNHNLLAAGLPKGYETWDFEARCDWQVHDHFPYVVDWLERWIAVADEANSGSNKYGDLRIIVTTFEDMLTDQVAFFSRLLAFFGLDPGGYPIREDLLPKTYAPNFRLGRTDEWRSVFPERLQAEMWERLAPNLGPRFNWTS